MELAALVEAAVELAPKSARRSKLSHEQADRLHCRAIERKPISPSAVSCWSILIIASSPTLRKADGCSTNETEANVGHTAPATYVEEIVEVGTEIDRTCYPDTSKPLYNSRYDSAIRWAENSSM